MPNYLVNVNGGATYEFGQYFANNETWVPWTKDGQVVTAHLEGGKGGWWGAQQVGPAQPCSTSAQSRGLAVCAAAHTRLLVGHTLRGGESTREQEHTCGESTLFAAAAGKGS